MDYRTRIDQETWTFIEETGRYYPPDTIDQSIEDQRRIYDRMCREFFQGYPAGVTVHDAQAVNVPIRVYSKGDAGVTVVYFHGGGFVVGGLESHDDVCAEICDRTGFRVVSVDYRLAPEFKHPAMFDDAISATRFVLAQYDGSLLLCGDSAGGNLAAAVAQAMRGETKRIVGQVLIYPGLGGDMSRGSYNTHAEAPMLRREEVEFYANIRLAGSALTGDASFAPLQDRDFSGLPPSVIFTAECDPLADDGKSYRDAILSAGGNCVWFNETGLVHGYLRARTTVRRAADSFDRIITALAALGRGDWPY